MSLVQWVCEKEKESKQTSIIPESQICQRYAGTSYRFPAALVSHRSYSRSTQTHHSRHPLHSLGSAGSQLEKENKSGEGPYHLFTAETAADCNGRVGKEVHTAWRHNSTFATIAARIAKPVWHITTEAGGCLCSWPGGCFGQLPEREKGCGAGGKKSNFPSWGGSCKGTLGLLCHSAPLCICTD